MWCSDSCQAMLCETVTAVAPLVSSVKIYFLFNLLGGVCKHHTSLKYLKFLKKCCIRLENEYSRFSKD